MGVRKFYNKWRYYIVDVKGKTHTGYLATEKLAQNYVDKIQAQKCKAVRYTKRTNSLASDLPVGLSESYDRKIRNGQVYEYPYIRATIKFEGKIKTFQRNFGINVTRKSAISKCRKWRNDMIKKINAASK
jgi:hypothetical protein